MIESFIRRFRDESRLHYRLSQGNLHIARRPPGYHSWRRQRRARSIHGARVVEGLSPGRGLELATSKTGCPRRGGAPPRPRRRRARVRAPPGRRGSRRQPATWPSPRRGTYRVKVLDFAQKIAYNHAPRWAARGLLPVHLAPAFARAVRREPRQHRALERRPTRSTQIMVELLRRRASVDGDHLGQFAQAAVDPIRRPTPRFFGVNVADEVEAVFAGRWRCTRAIAGRTSASSGAPSRMPSASPRARDVRRGARHCASGNAHGRRDPHHRELFQRDRRPRRPRQARGCGRRSQRDHRGAGSHAPGLRRQAALRPRRRRRGTGPR